MNAEDGALVLKEYRISLISLILCICNISCGIKIAYPTRKFIHILVICFSLSCNLKSHLINPKLCTYMVMFSFIVLLNLHSKQ